MSKTDGSYFSALGTYSKVVLAVCAIVLLLTAGATLGPLFDGSSQDSVTYDIRDQGDYVGEVTMKSTVDSTNPEVGSDEITYIVYIKYDAHPDQRAINPSINFNYDRTWEKHSRSFHLQPGEELTLEITISVDKHQLGGRSNHPVDARAYIEVVHSDPNTGGADVIESTSHDITYWWPYWERPEPYAFLLALLISIGIITRPAVTRAAQSWERRRDTAKKAQRIAETLTDKTERDISPPDWTKTNTAETHSRVAEYSDCLDTMLMHEQQSPVNIGNTQIDLPTYYDRLANSYTTDTPTLEEISRELDAINDLHRWCTKPFPADVAVASPTTGRKVSLNGFVAQQCRTALASGDPSQIRDTAETVIELARDIAHRFDETGAYTDDYLFNNTEWICDPAVQDLQDAIEDEDLARIIQTFNVVESIGALSADLQTLDRNTNPHADKQIYDAVYEGIENADPDRIEEAITQHEGQQALDEVQSLLDEVEIGLEKTKTELWRTEMREARESEDWQRIISLKDTVAERVQQQWKLEDLLALSPGEFESLVANLWDQKGFQTTVTEQSNDRGVDVIARKDETIVLIQAKRYHPDKSTVGGPTVRETAGALQERGADKCVVVTSGTFSEQAVRSARSIPGVKLIGHRELITELNESALTPP